MLQQPYKTHYKYVTKIKNQMKVTNNIGADLKAMNANEWLYGLKF